MESEYQQEFSLEEILNTTPKTTFVKDIDKIEEFPNDSSTPDIYKGGESGCGRLTSSFNKGNSEVEISREIPYTQQKDGTLEIDINSYDEYDDDEISIINVQEFINTSSEKRDDWKKLEEYKAIPSGTLDKIFQQAMDKIDENKIEESYEHNPYEHLDNDYDEDEDDED